MCRLRSHTASAHKMKITEYKNRFGADLDILEVVFHRSLILLMGVDIGTGVCISRRGMVVI